MSLRNIISISIGGVPSKIRIKTAASRSIVLESTCDLYRSDGSFLSNLYAVAPYSLGMTKAADVETKRFAQLPQERRGGHEWLIPGVFLLFVLGLASLVLLKLWVLVRMLLG